MAISRKQRKLIADELKQKRRWHYLSFATDYGFLGAVVVRGHGPVTAEQCARDLKIHPGGEVMCQPLNWRDMKRIPADLRDRLLTEAEVRKRLEGTRV